MEEIKELSKELSVEEIITNDAKENIKKMLFNALPEPEVYATGVVRDSFGNIKN